MNRRMDERTNFLSPKFDPLFCLNNPELVRIPYPKVKSLEYVKQCSRLLPNAKPVEVKTQEITKSSIQRKQKRMIKEIEEKELKEKLEASLNENYVPFSHRLKGNLYEESIKEKLNAGPFKLLFEALNNTRKIEVTIRNQDSIRSQIIGFLSFYDKHFNLLLQDAIEKWDPAGKQHELSAGKMAQVLEQKVITDSQGIYCRSIGTIYIRGQQVVSISFH
ncbi:hypothetical protein ROZALSC1DRAFT_20421 [Rozella allomycis CSF55]|uniref:Sm domain-containing protein n=1 Tax=Rozella allomycis (strain CSF55) TaxID=988480 RepID=A0A4P9YPK6_ROZAC|nr:hypothetical protein ROZALSC1DRAFT_20421 [Rozella allomycis CSF55]